MGKARTVRNSDKTMVWEAMKQKKDRIAYYEEIVQNVTWTIDSESVRQQKCSEGSTVLMHP
jgi:hypothetical protein